VNRWCKCLLVAQTLLWMSATAAGADTLALDKASGCRFQAPASWNYPVLHWTGPCEKSLASGSGVLRGYRDGKVVETFYGSYKDGKILIGVIETAGGFIAGRFENGKRVESDDPQGYIDAFRAASAAATQASETFRRNGNDASAQYYAEKAKLLDQQMGD